MAKKWSPPNHKPTPARAYLVTTFDDPAIYAGCKREIESIFGRADYESIALDGDEFPSLYGPHSHRSLRLLSFKRQIAREELVDLRKQTLNVEYKHQYQGRPLIEFDPGYITEYAVVRSSLEDDFHRIYLYHGVYGETLYHYEKLSFQPTAHTPTCFKQKEVITFFNDLRLLLAADVQKS